MDFRGCPGGVIALKSGPSWEFSSIFIKVLLLKFGPQMCGEHGLRTQLSPHVEAKPLALSYLQRIRVLPLGGMGVVKVQGDVT